MNDVVLEGELSGHPFVEVLQLAVNKGEPLKIELLDQTQLFGEVYLEGTLLLDARVDVLVGIQALSALLRLNEGHFRVLRQATSHQGSLNRRLDAALFACASLEDRESDERRTTILSMVPPSDER